MKCLQVDVVLSLVPQLIVKRPNIYLLGFRVRTSTDVQRAKWTAFVKKHVANFQYNSTSRICFRHFTEECFSNYHQYKYQQEESIRLMLKKHSNIIPTRNIHIKADSVATPRKQKPTTLLPTRERRAVAQGLLSDA